MDELNYFFEGKALHNYFKNLLKLNDIDGITLLFNDDDLKFFKRIDINNFKKFEYKLRMHKINQLMK